MYVKFISAHDVLIIIIIAVISVGWYVTSKAERTVIYTVIKMCVYKKTSEITMYSLHATHVHMHRKRKQRNVMKMRRREKGKKGM